MILPCRVLFAAIRPSSLTIRPARSRVLYENRSADRSLKSIRKELGITRPTKDYHPEGEGVASRDPKNVETVVQNLKNKLHRNIWLCMKRRDRPQFEEVVKKLTSSNIPLDGVSYTLMIHANLFFGSEEKCFELLQKMKEAGVHPSLIRFNARIVASCQEMKALNAYPIQANIAQMTRGSWLTAVMIGRRYPSVADMIEKERKTDESHISMYGPYETPLMSEASPHCGKEAADK